MYTVTFYSYKGGVGRTMALMNVAYRLNARRKRVFIIDFDLEAPGIDVFCKFADEPRPGLVEYVSRYSTTGSISDLSQYVSIIDPQTPETFPIHVLPAGRKDNEYQTLLAHLNWKEFYSSDKHGFLFVENLKAAIEAEYHPDYLLIDSRTGLTDISGICTLQLPDLVVLLFGLNQQNVQGISRIYKSIAHNKLNRQIKTTLVASPVPELAAYSEMKATRLQAATEQVGAEIEMSIPFDPSIAFEEAVVLMDKTSALGQAYDALAERIIKTNDFDFLNVVKAATTLQRAGDIDDADAKFQELIETFPKNPDAWEAYGRFLRSTSRMEAAIKAWQNALRFGGRTSVRGELASAYLVTGNRSVAQEHFSKYLERPSDGEELCQLSAIFATRGETDLAIAGFERTLELIPSNRQAMFELGNLHLYRLDPDKALPYIIYALDADPSSMAANFNYGFALILLGRKEEARTFYAKAAAIFEKFDMSKVTPALRANTQQAMGQCYRLLGRTEEASRLFKRAIKLADSLPRARIYSSVRYRDIPSAEFKAETEAMLLDMKREAGGPAGGPPNI
jgi:tetratricopeptide (TPR) repeat protein